MKATEAETLYILSHHHHHRHRRRHHHLHYCCCSLLAGLPLGTLARLDRVLRSAARLVGGGCPSFLPSLPTCVMYSIGCLYLSGYSIASLQWSPVVSLA